MDDVGSRNIRSRIQLNLPQNNHRDRTGNSGLCRPRWVAGHGSPSHREISRMWRAGEPLLLSCSCSGISRTCPINRREPSVFFPSPVTALNRRPNSTPAVFVSLNEMPLGWADGRAEMPWRVLSTALQACERGTTGEQLEHAARVWALLRLRFPTSASHLASEGMEAEWECWDLGWDDGPSAFLL